MPDHHRGQEDSASRGTNIQIPLKHLGKLSFLDHWKRTSAMDKFAAKTSLAVSSIEFLS